MPFNGVGVASVAGSNAVTGTPIDSASYNAMRADANGMWTNCVTRDGQSPWTANIPAGGFRLTGLGAPVVGTDAARLNTVAWELLDNQTVTNGATTVDVVLPTSHTAFEVHVIRAAPNASAALGAQVSFDNGATWWSTPTAYQQSTMTLTNASAFSGGANTTSNSILFGPSVNAAASGGFASVRMTVHPATGLASSVTHFQWQADLVNATGGFASPLPHVGSAYTNGTGQQPNRLRVFFVGTTFVTTNRNTRVVLSGIRA